MSTDDVPGYKPENRDALAMGCWAEHDDGSLIFVESTEGGRVIYSVFDMSLRPITEYRDSMAEGAFKRTFSWDGDKKKDRWTWHDKTPFPWDRIIKEGARDGTRYASAEDHLNAAQRVRRSREIHQGHEIDVDDLAERVADKLGVAGVGIVKQLQAAISKLAPGRGRKRR